MNATPSLLMPLTRSPLASCLVLAAATALVITSLTGPNPAMAADEAAGSPQANAASNNADSESAQTPADADADADAAKAPKSDDALPKLEKLTEGMTPITPIGGDGLFTLYRYPETERKRDTTKLLARIPASLLDKDLLVALSISRGQLAGWQWGDALVRFRLQGGKLIMESPDARYYAGGEGPLVESIRRTYRPTIIAAVPIETMVGGDPVIDLGDIVTDKPGRIPGGPGSPDRSLSAYHKIKVFPDNVLIDVDLAVRQSDQSVRMVGVSYAFRRLPENNGFKPRLADERIGYFLEARQNWTLPTEAKETVERFIQRWDLRKADPSLEVSPPLEPIVFYIEKTVPIRWRHWVQAGVLEWNKAFEALGFVNAIEVRQQTDDNAFAEFDPEDARYNFIRWIIMGNPFGMGPRRSDPRTGQILDADIIIDDTFLRAYQVEIERLVLGQQFDADASDALELYERYPQFAPRHLDLPPGFSPRPEGTDTASHGHEPLAADAAAWAGLPTLARGIASLGESPVNPFRADAHAGHRHGPGEVCEMSQGFGNQLALAHMALASASMAHAAANADTPEALETLEADADREGITTARGVEIPDRLLGQIIKSIVTHEVGHALGLRHNFKASAWLPLDEIKARRDAGDEPTVASVMDYSPLLIFEGDRIDSLRNIVSDPTIGPYDHWAIEYGYRLPEKGQSEPDMLREIARRNTEPELAYATDEDTGWINTPDPLINRWDLSSDLMDWSRSRVSLTDDLLEDIRRWALDTNDPAYYLRSTFNSLISERARSFRLAAQIVSGQYMTRNRFSDPDADPAFTLIDPDRQREALRFLGDTIFSESFFEFDPELYNYLSPIRWKDWATRDVSRLDYPVHQMALTFQSPVTASLVAPPVLQRVYDAELKSDAPDKFTAAELLRDTTDMIWSELAAVLQGRADGPFTEADPMVGSIRRNLQNDHLDMLLAYAEPGRRYYVSSDLHRMVRFATRRLADRIGEVLERADGNDLTLDFATRAHLVEAKSRIDRFLEAQYQAR